MSIYLRYVQFFSFQGLNPNPWMSDQFDSLSWNWVWTLFKRISSYSSWMCWIFWLEYKENGNRLHLYSLCNFEWCHNSLQERDPHMFKRMLIRQNETCLRSYTWSNEHHQRYRSSYWRIWCWYRRIKMTKEWKIVNPKTVGKEGHQSHWKYSDSRFWLCLILLSWRG